jgi:hypothetical protein
MRPLLEALLAAQATWRPKRGVATTMTLARKGIWRGRSLRRSRQRYERTSVLVHKYQGPHDTVRAMVANVLFLHNVAWLAGAESTMVAHRL